MPALTRRRSTDAREEYWHIYYGACASARSQDASATRLTLTPGNGYPGSHPRECTSDTSETFEQARTDFEAPWAVFLSKRTPADFQAWREQQAWTPEKYRRFDRGERMPPDWKPQFPSWLHHG